MIKFKMIKPFFFEMFSLICVISIFCFGFFSEQINKHFIEIKIHVSVISIAFIIICMISFIEVFSRIMNIGIRSLVDFILQSTKEDSYIFIKELPYQASHLAAKCEKKHGLSYGMYYLIQVMKDGKIRTFISTKYLDLEKGKTYTIKTAASSHIVLDYQISAHSNLVEQ